MRRLLFDERPLVVNPELACHIGLHEAIILQQVHYWVGINTTAKKNERDDYYWTFNSYPEWRQQFPFWSTRTIQRLIRSLERKGLLISANFNKLSIDRTKWYRIDYDKLSLWKATICLEQNDNVSQPLPETTTETIIEDIGGKASRLSRNPKIAELQRWLGYPEPNFVCRFDCQGKDPIPNPAKEAMFIKKMLKRGFSWEKEILHLWKMKVAARNGEFVSMRWVNEDIGKGGENGAYRGDTEEDRAARRRASIGAPIVGARV